MRRKANFPSRRPHRLAALILLSLALLFMVSPAWARNWQVYFSPGGGASEAIVKALGRAKNSVYVQAFSFTSPPIAKGLTQAQRRGVKVEAILDKSNLTDKYSAADFLAHAGIPTYIDSAHAIAHNKIIIIDEHLVITGSFNFTRAAERNNAENLLVIDDAELASRYLENWRKHLEHSEEYQGKEEPLSRRERGISPGTRSLRSAIRNLIEGASR